MDSQSNSSDDEEEEWRDDENNEDESKDDSSFEEDMLFDHDDEDCAPKETCNNNIKQDNSTPSLLFLCQEGQFSLARRRFAALAQGADAQVRRRQEVLERCDIDDNNAYALHEIFMHGTTNIDNDAKELALEMLHYMRDSFTQRQQLKILCHPCPPQDERTPLHWACWGNAPLEILQSLIQMAPDAMIMRDAHEQRTPLDLLVRYFPQYTAGRRCLTNAAQRFAQLRLQWTLQLCVRHYFFSCSESLITPFNAQDRQRAGVKCRKAWFVASVLASLRRHEMSHLTRRILSFVHYQGPPRKERAKRQKAGTRKDDDIVQSKRRVAITKATSK